MFLLFRKACLLDKTSKIVFSQIIFTIYNMGIQGVTRGYRGLQGVTRGYKGFFYFIYYRFTPLHNTTLTYKQTKKKKKKGVEETTKSTNAPY